MATSPSPPPSPPSNISTDNNNNNNNSTNEPDNTHDTSKTTEVTETHEIEPKRRKTNNDSNSNSSSSDSIVNGSTHSLTSTLDNNIIGGGNDDESYDYNGSYLGENALLNSETTLNVQKTAMPDYAKFKAYYSHEPGKKKGSGGREHVKDNTQVKISTDYRPEVRCLFVAYEFANVSVYEVGELGKSLDAMYDMGANNSDGKKAFSQKLNRMVVTAVEINKRAISHLQACTDLEKIVALSAVEIMFLRHVIVRLKIIKEESMLYIYEAHQYFHAKLPKAMDLITMENGVRGTMPYAVGIITRTTLPYSAKRDSKVSFTIKVLHQRFATFNKKTVSVHTKTNNLKLSSLMDSKFGTFELSCEFQKGTRSAPVQLQFLFDTTFVFRNGTQKQDSFSVDLSDWTVVHTNDVQIAATELNAVLARTGLTVPDPPETVPFPLAMNKIQEYLSFKLGERQQHTHFPTVSPTLGYSLSSSAPPLSQQQAAITSTVPFSAQPFPPPQPPPPPQLQPPQQAAITSTVPFSAQPLPPPLPPPQQATITSTVPFSAQHLSPSSSSPPLPPSQPLLSFFNYRQQQSNSNEVSSSISAAADAAAAATIAAAARTKRLSQSQRADDADTEDNGLDTSILSPYDINAIQMTYFKGKCNVQRKDVEDFWKALSPVLSFVKNNPLMGTLWESGCIVGFMEKDVAGRLAEKFNAAVISFCLEHNEALAVASPDGGHYIIPFNSKRNPEEILSERQDIDKILMIRARGFKTLSVSERAIADSLGSVDSPYHFSVESKASIIPGATPAPRTNEYSGYILLE